MLGVAAEPVTCLGLAERTPLIVLEIQGLQRLSRRYIAEPVPTSLTTAVLEVERLSAVLALEELHGRSW